MLEWQFNAADYQREKAITPGKYRVKIESAEEQTAKSGKDMIKLTLNISGISQKLYYYLVFLPEKPEITNNNLGRIFDSFGIEAGNLNVLEWKGKLGAAELENELDNSGDMRPKVKYFLKRKEQENLPAWQESEENEAKKTDSCPF